VKQQNSDGKTEFIDPKVNYEERDQNRRTLWKKVSKMRQSKFELSGFKEHHKSIVTPRDRLLTLDPIQIDVAGSLKPTAQN